MATTMRPIDFPSTGRSSPHASETALAPRPWDGEISPPRNSSSKVRRSPSRLPLRTGFRNLSGVATVLVGEPGNKLRPETKYLVHKGLLTAASPFFAAALNGTFAEGLDQTVKLPEEKPEIFEWFLQWLYTGTLKTAVPRCYCVTSVVGKPSPSSPGHPAGAAVLPSMQNLTELSDYDLRTDGDLRNSQGSPKYFLLLDLYALSDRLLTTPLSNHILSTIARLSETTNSVPTPSDTWVLYDTIRESSTLRTLILDLFAYKKTDRLLETHEDEWHPKFLRDLCVKLKRPGAEAVDRHSLVAWRPPGWSSSKACEICKDILQPGLLGDKCVVCEKAFCGSCLRYQGKMLMPCDTSGCKPWAGRGMCVRYHEHVDGEACG